MVDESGAKMLYVWRCTITGNPAGTDTHIFGRPCNCQGCRAAAEINRLKAENAKMWADFDALKVIVLANESAKDAEIDRLRAALKPFAAEAKHYAGFSADSALCADTAGRIYVSDLRAAVNALA